MADLQKMSCDVCGHTDKTLELNSKCHPWAGFEISYHPQLKQIYAHCKICRRVVTKFDVSGIDERG